MLAPRHKAPLDPWEIYELDAAFPARLLSQLHLQLVHVLRLIDLELALDPGAKRAAAVRLKETTVNSLTRPHAVLGAHLTSGGHEAEPCHLEVGAHRSAWCVRHVALDRS